MKHEKEHLDFVLRLLKAGGAGYSDKEMIFQLYKKYIDPSHLNWTDTACNSCSSSIQRMWQALKEYTLNNRDKFEN